MSTPHISKQLEFIGRQREMKELRAALEDVKSGNGRLKMVTGAPGIGKSRTAQEVAKQAEECGFQTFWGRCYEAQGAPPYWPWIRVLRAYVEQCDAEQLRLLMGAGAADIAEIVPELRERLPDLKPPTPLEPEQARFQLFDSITTFLKRSAQLKPMLLVLDDIHQADRPSMLLVEFLAREMAASHIFLLGTYRDTDLTRRHPLTRTLGELAREPVFHRIVLQGFSEDEVAQVIKSYSGSFYGDGMVRAVHTKTEGNPLFVTEVVWLLNHEGRLHAANASHRFSAAEEETWKITIPLGVQEAISSRLDRLSERCHEALVLASVIGREFDLDLLRLLLADIITEL